MSERPPVISTPIATISAARRMGVIDSGTHDGFIRELFVWDRF
jgi:hypothetical protein